MIESQFGLEREPAILSLHFKKNAVRLSGSPQARCLAISGMKEHTDGFRR
jgi:hypothetical protein